MFLDIVEKRDVTYGPYRLPVSIWDVLCPRSLTVKNAIYGYLDYVQWKNEEQQNQNLPYKLLKKEKQMVHVYDLYCTIECKHRQTWFRRRYTCVFITRNHIRADSYNNTNTYYNYTSPQFHIIVHVFKMGPDFPFFITRLWKSVLRYKIDKR